MTGFQIVLLAQSRLISMDDLTLVLTMGRVGSSAVYHAVKIGGPDVLHIHHIKAGSLLKRSPLNLTKAAPSRNVFDGYRARALLEVAPVRPVKIVTLVRDPIERNISASFIRFCKRGNLEQLNDLVTDPVTTDPIWARKDLSLPYRYFDDEFRDELGIDLYQTDVATRGHGQVEVGRFNTLAMHSVLPDDVKSEVLSTFLGRDVTVGRTGRKTSEGGELQELYKRFESTCPLTEADIRKAAESRFVQHFFAVDTNEYVAKWKTRLNLTEVV